MLRYNFRLYPNSRQQLALAQAFGCARVVFNDGIRAREEARAAGLPYIRDADLQNRLTVQAKKTPERSWLGEVPSVVLVQAIRDMHQAYRNFFNSLSGKRKGPKLGPPRFRSRKDTRQSIRFTRGAFRVRDNGRLQLAKLGELEVRWSRALPGQPSSVTIIRDSSGRYFASFVVQVEATPLPRVDEEIGVDLGLNFFAVDSKGRKIANPRFLRNHERRLRKAQQALARKVKGSANRTKARVKLARRYARVADTRRDWLHQATTRLIRENQAIYLEDLAVSGLIRTRLAKSVHDAGWGMFRQMLEAKAARYGRHVAVVGRFIPTSQLCSECGHHDGRKPLQIRQWSCGSCGATHDRDHNAAKNILAAGRAERLNACGGGVRPEHAQAAAVESGTRSCAVETVDDPSTTWRESRPSTIRSLEDVK